MSGCRVLKACGKGEKKIAQELLFAIFRFSGNYVAEKRAR